MRLRIGILICAAALLAGCGGGGSSSSPVSVVPKTTAHGGTGNVQFTVVIPSKIETASHGEKPQYISSNTLAGSVAVNGGTPQYFQLNIGDPSQCSGSPLTCTIDVQAQAGSDTFAWNLYDQAAAPSPSCSPGSATPCTGDAGNVLSTYTSAGVNVTASTNNILGTFTLNPVLASYSISDNVSPVPGTASGPDTITLTAYDPSGATIIGPGEFVNASGTLTPITISTSLSSLASPFDSLTEGLSFITTPLGGPASAPAATGTWNGPGDTVTVSYGGLSIPASTFTTTCAPSCTLTDLTQGHVAALGAPSIAEACNDGGDTCSNANTSGSTATPAEAGEITFNGVVNGDNYATLTPAELGWTEGPYSQDFVITSNSCGGIVSVTGTSPFTAQAVAPGGCAVTFEDSATLGQTVTINFTVT
jgi:hypothetical protein